LSSEKLTGSVTPATVAVAVNLPAVAFASNDGEVATPEAFVVSVAWAEPPAKLAPGLALDPAEPDPPAPEPMANVTLVSAHDAAVEHLDLARQRAASSRSWVITTIVAPAACSSCSSAKIAARCAVEVPGRLVGEHDRRLADERAGDRDALALTARELVGRNPARCASPTCRQRLGCARSRRTEAGRAGVEQPVGDVVEHGLVLGEEELLEDEADPRRAQGRELAVRQAGDIEPGDPHRARARRSSVPITCSSVDLPDPDGPTIATSSPRRTVKLTPASATTGGSAG
jgi:hypothetical protein